MLTCGISPNIIEYQQVRPDVVVDDIILASEEAIRHATRTIAETVRLVAEPSGAVTLAGMNTFPARFAGKQVVAVISGGNADFGACKLGQT